MQHSHLTAWQAYAPWPKRSQIEQDLRLSRGVADMNLVKLMDTLLLALRLKSGLI